MTNEEMQRTMEFILAQQAQFAVDLQKVGETQAETNQILNRLAAVTLEGFRQTNDKINALIESQMRTEEQQRKTDEQLRKTDEQSRKTDEKLGNLTDIVDRHLREEHGDKEGRGGDST